MQHPTLCAVIFLLAACTVRAEKVDLMTRYVITTYKVNQLSGVTSDEKRDFKLVRTTLQITKHAEDGKDYLILTSPAKEGNDTSEEVQVAVPFQDRDKILEALSSAATKMTKAAGAIKPTEGSELLWSNGADNDLAITIYTQTKTPKAFCELSLRDITYVLRTKLEFDKLIAAIKAVK